MLRRILLTLLALLLAAAAANAEGRPAARMDISIECEPDELTEPAQVTLHFALRNNTDRPLTDIRLIDEGGQVLQTLEGMAAGGTADLTQAYVLTAEELGRGAVPFLITADCEGEELSLSAQARVMHVQAKSDVEFLRRTLADVTDLNGDMTITYEVRNNGGADLSAVSVSDPLGDFSESIESLPAGARRTLVNRVHLTEDGASQPRLVFSTASSPEVFQTVELDPFPVRVAGGELVCTITAGHSLYSPDTAEVILRLSNTGTATYRDVTVYDDINGGTIADSITLPPGAQPVEVSHSYPIRGSASYRWRITATTPAGDVTNYVTDLVEVPSGSRSGLPQLSFSVEPRTSHISRSGTIPMTLRLQNTGSGLATQVQISEEKAGMLLTLTAVPTGEATVRRVELNVEESCMLNFAAAYLDPDGASHIVAAEPVPIEVSPGGVDPARQEGLFSYGASSPLLDSRLVLWLIGIAAALVVVLTAILIISSRRARFRQKVKAEARRQLNGQEAARKAAFRRPVVRRRK